MSVHGRNLERVNVADQAELRLLHKVEDIEHGERAADTLRWIKAEHPAAYWPLYGYLRRLLSRLERSEEVATLHIIRSHCPPEEGGP